MTDSSKTAIDSDALPTQLDLADWDSATLFVDGCPVANPSCDPATQGFSIIATIVGIHYVPEPSLGLLQMTALLTVLGLASYRRGRTAH